MRYKRNALCLLIMVSAATTIYAQHPKGFLLSIGLNEVDPEHYLKGLARIEACENDARHIQAIAIEAGGFEEIKLLLGAVQGICL